MKRNIKGSFTIEASIIVPLILFIFSALVHILFYYHDKNILMSTAHETAAVGSADEALYEIELEYYFFDRMEGRMLMFDRVECRVTCSSDCVKVWCDGSKKNMRVIFDCSMPKTNPENYIRQRKNIIEGIGK